MQKPVLSSFKASKTKDNGFIPYNHLNAQKRPYNVFKWQPNSLLYDKRAIVPFLFTLPGLLIVAVLGILLLIFLGGFALFLAFNLFSVLGAFLVILAALAMFKGFFNNYILALLIIGIGLLTLPWITDKVASLTIGGFIG